MVKKRVSVYVDGFNLYHAIKELCIKELCIDKLCIEGCKQEHLKWVNLWDLSEKLVCENEEVTVVKYFSAYARWLEPNYRRHQLYVKFLEKQGVTFIEGRFKRKRVKCQAKCQKRYQTREEKETDVNIGVHLMADGLNDRFDRALVISADTDLNGAVELTSKETNKQIHIVAPPGRRKKNSKSLFEIKEQQLQDSLLPQQITHEDNKITRPTEYDPPQN